MSMLIPRFAPEYNFNDLLGAINNNCRQDGLYKKLQEVFGENATYLLRARAGIHLILSPLPPGEIILPAYICYTVPEAVILAGHRPRFVDIDPGTLCMPLEQVERVLTSDTRGIIGCHTFGIPCNVIELIELAHSRGIVVLEDAASAFGAAINHKFAGTFGDAAVYSFNKGKPMSLGRGAVLVLNNKLLQEKLELLLNKFNYSSSIVSLLNPIWEKIIRSPKIYYWAYHLQKFRKGGDFWEKGSNNKINLSNYALLMDNLLKKLLASQLMNWEKMVARRREIGNEYRLKIKNKNLRHFKVGENYFPVWAGYPVLVEQKKAFFEYMQNKGVDLNWSWNYNAAEIYGQGNCQKATYVADRILSFPVNTLMQDMEIEKIISIANGYRT